MHNAGVRTIAAAVAVLSTLSACAVVEESISAPDVNLTAVKLETLDFSGQTFKLSFDVSNPNAFPLPVNLIDYGVSLDGHRFASGRTDCDIMVPAGGDTEFDISVELDLLKSAPALLSVVHDSAKRDIPYSLEGRVSLAIPATKPLKFEQSGRIQMTALLD
jgi:LEA14-like dessication related protein